MAPLWYHGFCLYQSLQFSQVLQSVAGVGLVMLWSEPLALCVCCSENECNEVKVLIVCTFAAQVTGRFTFGFLMTIPREKSPLYLLDFLGAKTGMCVFCVFVCLGDKC